MPPSTAVLHSASVTPVNIYLTPKAGVSGGPGPESIAFLGACPSKISVYGVGGTETTNLRWEVRDSVGTD